MESRNFSLDILDGFNERTQGEVLFLSRLAVKQLNSFVLVCLRVVASAEIMEESSSEHTQ